MRPFGLFLSLLFLGIVANAQYIDHSGYVNPFIGTAKSNVLTKWGSEGGTYPGAVAPSGNVQLTPETRPGGGYNYKDSEMYYFSCFGHMSGFPVGSAGSYYIMPLIKATTLDAGKTSFKFSHDDESATPGYYKVITDGHIETEVTATQRTGIFRFTFQQGAALHIFIGDKGELTTVSEKVLYGSSGNVVINFSQDLLSKERVKDGWLFSFAGSSNEKTIVELRISRSTVSHRSAQQNIDKEIGSLSFEQVRQKTKQQWAEKLGIVDVDDKTEKNKTIFYTALYHSLLVPWVIDDVDGRYSGADGKIHNKTGKDQYGAFSPWDTFRSLNPLLALLYPEKETDIVLSMLDIYKQQGHLPIESMTGNHAIPIIVDSYLKGIVPVDKELIYTAMKKSILEPPFIQADVEVFNQNGYIPYTSSESVTRTMEYAYDNWALSQFAKSVMQNDKDYQLLNKRGFNYRNLLNVDQSLFLPRDKAHFKLDPGMSGYKEGDKWVYSYFVPHNTRDLINLTGGDACFATRLDSALKSDLVVFDNETVFHVPYLFNQAGKPWLTQKWCRQIMLERFTDTPGGLPGNDDLGSTSSWYIFSAMGLYPVSPGNPLYSVGYPIFKSISLHLANGKKLVINKNNPGDYVQALQVNGRLWKELTVPHSALITGGNITFNMGDAKNTWLGENAANLSVTKGKPQFKMISCSVSKKRVRPDERFTIYFTVANKGVDGVKITNLSVNDKAYTIKKSLVPQGKTLKYSIKLSLYAIGQTKLKLSGLLTLNVEVVQPAQEPKVLYRIDDLTAAPMIKLHGKQMISYRVKNITGKTRTISVPVYINAQTVFTDKLMLDAGESKRIEHTVNCNNKGINDIVAGTAKARFKVYKSDQESIVLHLAPVNYSVDNKVPDSSGFNNLAVIRHNGTGKKGEIVFDKDNYVEVENSPAVDLMDTTMTVMGWVYPTGKEMGLIDMITKGDTHVLQVSDQKTLTFFAGGWGRGDCAVNLPADWTGKWHHIAGVCDGRKLWLYVDGELAGTALTENTVNLSTNSKWTLGRNEEFPNERIFRGKINEVKIFRAPLTARDVKKIFLQSRQL